MLSLVSFAPNRLYSRRRITTEELEDILWAKVAGLLHSCDCSPLGFSHCAKSNSSSPMAGLLLPPDLSYRTSQGCSPTGFLSYMYLLLHTSSPIHIFSHTHLLLRDTPPSRFSRPVPLKYRRLSSHTTVFSEQGCNSWRMQGSVQQHLTHRIPREASNPILVLCLKISLNMLHPSATLHASKLDISKRSTCRPQ